MKSVTYVIVKLKKTKTSVLNETRHKNNTEMNPKTDKNHSLQMFDPIQKS